MNKTVLCQSVIEIQKVTVILTLHDLIPSSHQKGFFRLNYLLTSEKTCTQPFSICLPLFPPPLCVVLQVLHRHSHSDSALITGCIILKLCDEQL